MCVSLARTQFTTFQFDSGRRSSKVTLQVFLVSATKLSPPASCPYIFMENREVKLSEIRIIK